MIERKILILYNIPNPVVKLYTLFAIEEKDQRFRRLNDKLQKVAESINIFGLTLLLS